MTERGAARPDGPPAPPAGGRAWLAVTSLLALGLALAFTFQAWRTTRAAEEAQRRGDFEFQVREAASRVRQRMLAYEQVLRGAAGLFAASVDVERAEFRTYVGALHLESAYPGIQGLGFSVVVPAAQLTAHEAGIRREGFPAYAVWPPGRRDPYTAIVYLEPFDWRNARAFGFDMLSEPVRRAAMERARDLGEAALSGRVTLVQETDQDVQAGALLYLPIYRNGAPLDTQDARRAALEGWVYAPFRMRDLMKGILGDHAAGLDVELFDGDAPGPASLMFDADPHHDAARALELDLRAERALQVAGRRWTMVFDAREDPRAGPLPRSTLLALAGASAGGVLALLLWTLGSGRARALEAARRSEQDLADRHRAAEALEAAHRFAQATLDALPAQICVLDARGVILSANRAWRTFGAENGAPAGGLAEGTAYLEACDRAVGPAQPEARRFADRLRDVLQGRLATFTQEYECHAPSTPRWFVARATRFADGEETRVVVVHQEITERVRATAALREGERRLRTALEAARQVEWDLDVPAGTVAVGEGWRQLTGLALPPQATLDVLLEHVHGEDRAGLRTGVAGCLEGRADRVEVEVRLAAAAGGWRWARVRGQVTDRDEAGQPRRLAGTVTDIDEVHALQERLLAATRLASVGTLAAGVAHEINNPLAWMHANLSLGLELLDHADALPAPDRTELRQLVAESLEGTERIASIVKAMRSLGRPERPEEAHPVDLRAELLHAVQMVRNQLQQRAALHLDLPAGLPPVRARTSELGRVFLNLLLNAAQAVGDGGAQVHRVALRARVEGDEVVVEVSDTGPGIPPGVRERIFDPFFTTKPVGQGSGLGLPIARSIVDAAGGRIDVESEEGIGTTFRVHLPVASGAAQEAAPSALADPPSPSPRRRVLLVDDEPTLVRSLQRWLERTHDVTVLSSAEEALRRLDAGERWDALLFDLMMPGVDGPAVHQALATRHPALLGRLAFITGGAFGERASAFLAQHAVLVLPKPLELRRLLEVVEQLASA